MKKHGGCKCGQVRYEVNASLGFQFICQCRDCQKFSGSGYLANIMIPKDSLSITGQTTRYEYENESGEMRLQIFCTICGSNVHGGPKNEDFYCLRASSLDDPSIFTPEEVIYQEDAQPWDNTSS